MRYCLNGTDLGGWRDDGIDSCLYGTLGAVVPFTYSLIYRVFILIRDMRRRRRYKLEEGNQHDVENPLHANVSEEYKTEFSQKSWYFIMRMMLGSMLVLESAVRGVLEDMVTGQRDITGQQVLTAVLGGLTWMLYLSLENSSSSVPNNSDVKDDKTSKWLLAGFLCLVVLREMLAFLSWLSPWYWWSMERAATKTEFGLWVIRLSSCLLLITLKLLPSYLCSPRQHMVVNTEEKEEHLKKKKTRNKSTWANVFKKLRMMVPYVWPKGSVHKQGLVGACVLLLGLGRVVNLLVPIVSKEIIDSLSIHVVEKVKFATGDDLISTTPSRTFLGAGHPADTVSTSPSQTSLEEGHPAVTLSTFPSQTSLAEGHPAVTVSGSGVDTLTMNTERELMEIFPFFCWKKIVLYCFLMFFKGGGAGNSGMLNNARSFCWVPVQQYTTKHIQLSLFHHLQSLSLRWHLHRQTGEVLKIVDRGTNSINMLLSHLLFNIVPILADITIAIVFFVSSFNYLFGLIVFLCMATYISISVVLTEWRTKYRRDMNRLDNEKNAKAVDALLNFETVKYYGAADFEKNQYKEAITKYQKAEFVNAVSFNLLNLTQNVVILCGLMTGTLLCGWGVVHSLKGMQLTVGDYVLFGTYINQLYGPIQWLGNYYRMIQTAFVDMENMFDLFRETQEVKDVVGAEPIEITKGEIEFRNVSFHYDSRKPILKNVSFCVPPGQTYALVGHSGSGKSTVVRLLFRFYDVKEGCILIDGKDISQVQQESLRKIIGVVPQDIVMFNNNIKYNIRYGKVTSTEEEVEEAAEAADIHDRILTFPNKYDTVVGERGLKLSGGEKQRVAIARTLLKSPAVVLLDEATSALDTKTERNIQNSLIRVCEGRTTIVVAHRLSTIIHAHKILVMEEGEVVERGSHQELLDLQGIYAGMWQQQLTAMETNLNIERED